MWSIVVAIIGVLFLAAGALSALAALMPKFWGGSDEGALPVGVVLILCGVSMLFYAGTLT